MSQNPQLQSTQVDPDDLDNNPSSNPSLHEVMQARLHRRHVLKSGVGAMTMAGLTSLSLTACGGGSSYTSGVKRTQTRAFEQHVKRICVQQSTAHVAV